MQRLARLNSSAVALAISQNAKLENEMVEHLSDHLSEFVALHVVALLDPIVRSGDADGILIRPGRRPILMLQLARLLQNSQCQQLVCSTLGFALMLWIKEDLQQPEHSRQPDDNGRSKTQQLLSTTANGLKRIILRSQPEIQVAALQVLDALLLKCRQLTDGPQMMTVLMEQQDLAELMYDVLYANHLPLLEFALRCLHHLSRCPPFFQHRCVILGVEPLLRVIPHLADSNASALSGGLIVAYAVHLLSDMLSKYDGEESLLQRCVSSTDESNGGFHVACHIANMVLDSCALHLETGGVYLVAALLDRKNLPVPIPLDRVSELIRSCVKSLAPPDKKWKSETGRIHLQGLIRMLSSATGLIVYLTDDPRARLSSYASANSAQLASYQESLDKLIDLIVATIDELITAFQQVDKEYLWSDLFLVLVQLATGSATGAGYVQAALKAGFLLSRVYNARRGSSPASAERDSADELLTWFLARSLDGNQEQPSALAPTTRIRHHHYATLRGLVRSIPSALAEWSDWITNDKRSPFGAKCSALVLLYQLELCETSKEAPFAGDHSEALLTAVGDLMLTHSPCDMDDPDLLRSVWFLIARYSDGFHEASKAFVHLVKWFQPNGSLLLPWLRRIYTPHLSLMRWAFALKDIASYLGSYMILLWIDEDDVDGKKATTLVNLCLERSDDVLLLSVFDLAFHEDAGVSCCVASILERVAAGSESMRVAIGRMIKYNIPRFLRLTDVTDDNYSRLIGSLRLLCRLSSSSRQRYGLPVADAVISDDSISAWRDPAIVAALVSFLPRTIRFGQHQVKLGAMDLWSWSCRYLESVLLLSVTETTPSPSSRVLCQIVMENRSFIEFVDEIYRRDELPVWRNVAQLVAAMAAFHHLHRLKVISPVRVSMARLSRKLTAGLVGMDGEAAESLDVILQLLDWLLRDATPDNDDPVTPTTTNRRLLIDPSLEDDDRDPVNQQPHHRYCSQERNGLLEHLWSTLVNWTMRSADGSTTKNRIFACLSQLMRSCQRSLPPAQFALLAAQPWNYMVVVDAVRSPSSSSVEAVQLATALIRHSKQTLKSCGAHPWSTQLEETLSRHPPSQ
ncbi:uncharacterized protein LOC124336875 isoform X2 [Daphnia pulicaria]|nr:uncharacterized protein LOC124336875 isoform X2 [Daphnia pulicaria]XP_046646719.1 uncharacterized protein LOC124336875 isoform X2 [Daphnia pulicaria]